MHHLQTIDNENALWAIKNQHGLWDAMVNQYWLPFGGISAMPSIHVAMSVIFLLSSYCISKTIGIVFLAYLVIIQVGSIILGWHYAIDGYVSIMASILIWTISGKIIDYSESYI